MRPADLKYTKTHEWVRVEKDIATTGITDFAVAALSDLVYVDMPAVTDRTPICYQSLTPDTWT